MQNVEFKAELKDVGLARSIALALGAQLAGIMEQTDTYYAVRNGRLKRRETGGEDPEWILYDREDQPGPKISRFRIYTEQEALDRFGTGEKPVRIVVHKVREVYLVDNVRIHLDEVRDLGPFMELEAMVSARQGMDACLKKIGDLRRELAPALGEPIACGYADLLERESSDG
jgi:adenylate cyclase class IV